MEGRLIDHGISGKANHLVNRAGQFAAVSTGVLTLITFALAMTAVPISGANCPGDCAEYPYLDTAAQFPQDYRWMVFAMLVVVVYIILMAVFHSWSDGSRKVFSQIALSMAVPSACILITAYFLQFSIVTVSLMNGEFEGIPLLIQYNPHGVFIAMEELGYLMMSISFLFAGLTLAGRNRIEKVAKWIFLSGFVVPVIALVVLSFVYGLERLDRFEVIIITVDWLVLIVNGFLMRTVFKTEPAREA